MRSFLQSFQKARLCLIFISSRGQGWLPMALWRLKEGIGQFQPGRTPSPLGQLCAHQCQPGPIHHIVHLQGLSGSSRSDSRSIGGAAAAAAVAVGGHRLMIIAQTQQPAICQGHLLEGKMRGQMTGQTRGGRVGSSGMTDEDPWGGALSCCILHLHLGL